MKPNFFHWTPRKPCSTKAYPIVAPTTLCVPDTGKRRKEAINSQMLVPPKALKLPTMASFSVPLNVFMSIIPFRTVSERNPLSAVRIFNFQCLSSILTQSGFRGKSSTFKEVSDLHQIFTHRLSFSR